MKLIRNDEDFREWVESIINITTYDHLNYPTRYPCYAQMVGVNSSGIDYCYTNYLYKEDLIDMLGNINKIIKDSERSTPIRCACEVVDSNCGCSFGQCLNGLIY